MLARLILTVAMSTGATVATAGAYHAVGSVTLGGPDRWDYVVADAASGHVYIAHGDRVTVIDGRAGTMIGDIAGIAGGPHGIGIAGPLGVTDDGRGGQAVVFDTRTLAILRRVPAGADADGIAIDPATGHALIADGDSGTISVIDPVAARALATIAAGEEFEYLAAGDNRAFVAGKGRGDVIAIDLATSTVIAHWPMPDCVKPHGLALDAADHRVFVGCVNAKLAVLDAHDGHVVATLPIGRGSDAIAWDGTRRRLFSANGLDGTVSVIAQETPDRYRVLDPIVTKPSGRTMAVDPKTGRLFVAAGDPVADGTLRGHIRPGSLTLMMFDPE